MPNSLSNNNAFPWLFSPVPWEHDTEDIKSNLIDHLISPKPPQMAPNDVSALSLSA